MKTFEEIVNQIIWQKENVSLENAINVLKLAFSDFTLDAAALISEKDSDASALFYNASNKVREAMELQPQV